MLLAQRIEHSTRGIYQLLHKLKLNSSSQILITRLAQNVYVEKYRFKNSFNYVENDDGSLVRYPTRFQSQLEA